MSSKSFNYWDPVTVFNDFFQTFFTKW
jgi:hypothetical protein